MLLTYRRVIAVVAILACTAISLEWVPVYARWAIAVDGSSPARASGAGAGTNFTVTTASFTPPLDSLLAVCVEADSATTDTLTFTASNTGGAVTWVGSGAPLVARTPTEATAGGHASIHVGRVTTSASMTVTITRAEITTGGRVSLKVYVLTGVDVDGTPYDSVGANNEGGDTTNNMTTLSLTPGADGLLVVADTDWQALGTFQASSDLTSPDGGAHYAGAISVYDGYKTVTSGVATTANLNASGTSAAQHKWVQMIFRAAAGGAPPATPRMLLHGIGEPR